MLKIDNLHASVAGKEILKGLSLELKPGQVHAIMGPNGAGKSTLGNILAGREGYEVTAGTVEFDGRPLLELAPEQRAADGVFLAFQYPVEIPGVNNTYFLRSALNAQRKARGEAELDSMQFLKRVREKLAVLHLKDELLHRGVNEGFSGGEKKRNEIFQLAVLEPKLAILDETDSGLDIDALKTVADGVTVGAFDLDIPPQMYIARMNESVRVQHFLVGMSKAPVFAMVIGLIGCLEGLKVTGTAQSVGERTTSAVVQTISLVIILDAFFALWFMHMDW